MEVIAIRDRIAFLFSAASSARKQGKSDCVALRQTVIELDPFKAREAGWKRRVDALEAKLSSVKVELLHYFELMEN